MKKIISLLLVILMIAGVFAGCSGKGKGSVPTDPVADETKKPNDDGIINPGKKPGVVSKDYYVDYETDDLPSTLNYGGAEFSMLCDAAQYVKSFADTYTGDVINSAVYERKDAVEQRMGIELNVIRETGAYTNMADFMQVLEKSGESYDLVLSYNLTPARMAINGLIQDMTQSQYINFEKPWWSRDLLETVAINGKVYFNADNSSWNNLRNMIGLFVDKNLFTANHPDMNIDGLYDLVENKQWTMEKMFELVEGTYHMNGAALAPDLDTFGLSGGNQVWTEAWFYAAGFTTMSKDADGNMKFDLSSSEIVDFLDWFVSKYHNDSNNCYKNDTVQYKMFKEGRVQFYFSALSMVEQELTQPFAVLPLPMYQTGEGATYRTHFSNTYDMYAIPAACGTVERSGAVLECLASEAYRRIGPAYFEVYLKARNVSDERLADMYDIIRAGIVFDTGVLFGEIFDDGQNNPIYYVRRMLNKYHDTFGWNDNVEETYMNVWNAQTGALGGSAGN